MSDPSYSAWVTHGANMTVVDKVLPDMLHLIDPHWYKFPPMNPLWHGLLGFIIGVLGIISFCGNGMVLYIFGTTRSLRSPSNLLVMNLALSDFLMMLVMSPPMVVNCFYETWVFGRQLYNSIFNWAIFILFPNLGPLMCELYAMAGSMFGCGDIWTMVFIAMDRYNVIVRVRNFLIADCFFFEEILSIIYRAWQASL